MVCLHDVFTQHTDSVFGRKSQLLNHGVNFRPLINLTRMALGKSFYHSQIVFIRPESSRLIICLIVGYLFSITKFQNAPC